MIRAATSSAGPWDSPQARLARVNTASPATNRVLAPNRSPSRPAGTSVSSKASAYPETIHSRSADAAWVPAEMLGNATVTIVVSTKVRQLSNGLQEWACR